MKTLETAKKLFERYESLYQIQKYYGLFALYGLAHTAIESKESELLDKCIHLLGLYPDNFDHPKYNFDAYEVGGNGKVFLAYKGYFNEQHEKIRLYAEKTMNAPADSNGILCYPKGPHREKVFIDVVTAVTPFMLYAGLTLKEDKYIDFAAEQCFKMYEILLDRTCGLLHQAKGFMSDPELISHDHWGRGNGWGYLGLTELVVALPENSKHRKKAEKYYTDLSKAFIKYQTEKGLWRQELTRDYSWEESSGTGIIAYGLGVGLRTGLLDEETYKEPFERAINGIINYFINEDFSTNMGCYGCLCPGEGDEKGTIKSYLTEVYPYRDEPHSFGALMLALVEAHKNGITEAQKTQWLYFERERAVR